MNDLMTSKYAVSPADGPIAVTGASGYIGSWTVRDCVEQGYIVHACVRDKSNMDKVEHLLKLNDVGFRGSVKLFEADLLKPGSYDEPFANCSAVIHCGAPIGHNQETAQEVYDGCFTQNEHVIDSVKKTGTVKRFVFTSSFAAVWHPCPQGYVFTEKDWCGDNIDGYNGSWTVDGKPNIERWGYAMAKANMERMIYETASSDGSFQAMSILPLHVIGPLMAKNHDTNGSWQNSIKDMLKGNPYLKLKGGRMLWNNVDVRDVARAHRLCAETTNGNNGSRYILSASNRSGELFTWQLQNKLKAMYPYIKEIGGEEMEDNTPVKYTYDSPRAYCLLAKQQLGLNTRTIDQTIKDTVDSYFRIGLLS
jgi:nucleoside-diphosphate-sugar epimerase